MRKQEDAVQKITTCLAFADRAEEAVDHYVSIFKNGKIVSKARGSDGNIIAISFELFGQPFLAINGGPPFTFSMGISLMVNCDTQEEIDKYWRELSAGGQEVECGWVTDKFGVSWQIVPAKIGEWLGGDAAQSQRVMSAVMTMKKLDMAALQRAADGR